MARATILWGASIVALASTQVQAQQSDAPIATASEVSDTDAVATNGDDIVVTAQRRAEPLQAVPLAVTAISGDTLLQRGVNDISQLSKFVPGFSFGQTGNNARPSMRGARTAINNATGDAPIAIFVDGIYQSRTSQALLGFVDVSRVEVQRGPQGTLYGRNTFGGNVAIATNEPVDYFDYGAVLTVGNYERRRAEGFVNLPVADGLALRVAGAFEHADGWVKNDYNPRADLFDQRQRFIRGTLKFEPNDNLTAVIRAEYFRNGGNGASAFGFKQIGSYIDPGTCQPFYNASVYGLNGRVGNRDGVADCTSTVATPGAPAGREVDLGIPIHADGNPFRIDNDYQTARRQKSFQASADISYSFGDVAIRSISGYNDYRLTQTSDSDFSASTIAIDSLGISAETFSQELQILSEGNQRLEYVAGLYYYTDENSNLFINEQLPITVRSSATDALLTAAKNPGSYAYQFSKVRSAAAYAQFTFNATDRLSLIAGVRYTNERKQFRDASANGFLPMPTGEVPNPLTLITIDLPVPGSAYFPDAPSDCSGEGRAATRFDEANRYVSASYCPLKYEKVTWRGGVNFQVTPRNLLYASVATGFQSGGFNPGQVASQSSPTFAPQTVTAFEIGSKNRLFDNTLTLNLSAFYNKYRGLQEQRQIIVGSTSLQTVQNAAAGRSYGLEVEASWRPVKALNIGANLSLLNARYKDFDNIPLPYGTSILVNDASQILPTIVDGVVISPTGQRRVFAPGYECGPLAGTGGVGQPAVSFVCDLSGNRIPHSPEISGTVYAGYDIDLGSAGTLTPFAALTYSSSYFETQYNDTLSRQRGWTKVDLNLTWAPSEQLSIDAFVTNLTNAKIKTIVSSGGTPMQAHYEPPRMYGLRLTFRH
ncbi:TonB-dependent receptor [Sphingopyxis sp. MSC1_008]|jgi:iron complex outermembrane receptor protein|uniref:TonB-dependent receptor n=1 Tax=Sphingopyxis sp. MSC1_008 TaxID=2909265 RepID=UPI0020C12AE6|nr:TonB-dependent receptor [Sphingopyxis sp. MSC1_008]